jgi:antirestriction protein ArdC
MTKKDAYRIVTERIIEALQAGVVPWHRPWRSTGTGPMSMSTGKPYQGVNVWILDATAQLRGYSSPYWITFKQAQERGGNVRKGEKGTPIVFWKFTEKRNEAGEVTDRIPFLRYFTVFNVEQCDGIEAPVTEPLPERDPIETCESLARGYIGGPEVKHGGDRAYYSPALDYVQMPPLGAFETSEHYYGTLFHELAHSTGHADRLKRKSLVHPAPFGSEDYSREELVAEMAAAYLCGIAGIDVNVPHHASYIASWLKALTDDPKLVVQAAANAQKACNLIVGETLATTEEGSHAEPSDLGNQSLRRNHVPRTTPKRATFRRDFLEGMGRQSTRRARLRTSQQLRAR